MNRMAVGRCSSFPLCINASCKCFVVTYPSYCACLCAGSSGSVRSQPEEFSQQLAVPTDLFRPISPHSHSDSESIPRLPPPRRAHTLSRTLRRQVTKTITVSHFHFYSIPLSVPALCVFFMSVVLNQVSLSPPDGEVLIHTKR